MCADAKVHIHEVYIHDVRIVDVRSIRLPRRDCQCVLLAVDPDLQILLERLSLSAESMRGGVGFIRVCTCEVIVVPTVRQCIAT